MVQSSYEFGSKSIHRPVQRVNTTKAIYLFFNQLPKSCINSCLQKPNRLYSLFNYDMSYTKMSMYSLLSVSLKCIFLLCGGDSYRYFRRFWPGDSAGRCSGGLVGGESTACSS